MLWWTLRQLHSKDESTRIQAINQLASSKLPEAGDHIISQLLDKSSRIRIAALKALGSWQFQGINDQPLRDALRDGDADVRRVAVTLYKGNADDTEKYLEPLLQDADAEIRQRARAKIDKSRDLAKVHLREAVNKALNVFSNAIDERRFEFRRFRVSMGMDSKHPIHEQLPWDRVAVTGQTGIDILETYLSSPESERLRWVAALALGRMQQVSAVPVLAQTLFIPNPGLEGDWWDLLRFVAKKILLAMGCSASASLVPLINKEPVRKLLVQMQWAPVTDEHKLWIAREKKDWETIIKIGGPFAKEVTRGVVDLQLAIALAAANDPEGIQILGNILNEDESHFSGDRIRAAATLATYKHDRKAAEPLLTFLAKQPRYSFFDRAPSEGAMWLLRLRKTAVKSLGDLGVPEAVKLIRPLLDGSDLDIAFCKTSIQTLEKILKHAGEKVDSSELLALAISPDINIETWVGQQKAEEFARPGRIVASCEGLRAAARRELQRRGASLS